jgi:hypothetical protein
VNNAYFMMGRRGFGRHVEEHGYRALALKGGYMAWLRAAYPVQRKEATAALPAKALCPACGQPLATHAREAGEQHARQRQAPREFP